MVCLLFDNESVLVREAMLVRKPATLWHKHTSTGSMDSELGAAGCCWVLAAGSWELGAGSWELSVSQVAYPRAIMTRYPGYRLVPRLKKS